MIYEIASLKGTYRACIVHAELYCVFCLLHFVTSFAQWLFNDKLRRFGGECYVYREVAQMVLKIAANATSLLVPMTGIGRYTYNLFSEIIKTGECEIGFLYGFKWGKELVVPRPQNQTVSKVVKSTFPYARTFRRTLQGKVLKHKISNEKYDLHHEPNFLPLDFSIPVVSTIHDLSILRYPEYHPRDRVKMYDKYLHSTIERSTCLIADSNFVRNEIIEIFGIKPEKVVTTLLGVEKSFYPRKQESTLKLLDAYDLKFKSFFLVVSTLEPRKNFKLVIDAYMRLSNAIKEQNPLVIVGMNGWEMSQFDKDLDKLKRQGFIRMLGYVDNEALPLLYSSAKIFLYPSFYEGFGLPSLEAMACGTPVITSNTSSLPEVVGDAGIMVSPFDDVDLFEQMSRLVEDEALLAKLSISSVKRAELFSWKKCAAQTVDVYRRICS